MTKHHGLTLRPDLAQAAAEGRKLMTRRPEKEGKPCPYAVGDLIWWRELWAADLAYDRTPPSSLPPDADLWWGVGRANTPQRGKDRPANHMPKRLARTWARVVRVRRERVQQISAADARAEGCPVGAPDPRSWFAGVWSDCHGVDAWESSPWVDAIALEPCERPDGL